MFGTISVCFKMSKQRFVLMNDSDLERKNESQKNGNTEKSNRRADRAFRTFLEAMGRETNDCDYWDFTEESLDDYLAKFWFGARKNVQDDSEEESQETEDPELKCRMYKANSLKNYRYALNRILKKKRNIDITLKDNKNFTKSQEAFANVMRELKTEGKAESTMKYEITEQGELIKKI